MLRSIFKLAIFFIVITGSFTYLEAQKIVTLKDGQEQYPLGLCIEVLKDPSRKLSIKDVISPQYNSAFRYSQKRVLNFGFTKSNIWIRFKINNEASTRAPWALELGYPNLNYVDLYQLSAAGEIINKKKTGNLRSLESRDHKHHNIVFLMVFSKQETQTVYLRFQNQASMTIPLTLWSMTAFMKQSQMNYTIVGGVIGVLLIMMGFNAFLFFSLRDKSYLYYFLSIGSILMFSLTVKGLALVYLWPNLMEWNQMALPIFAGLMLISLIKFTDVFLLAKKQMPLMHKVFHSYMILVTFFIFLVPFTRYRLIIRLLVIAGILGCLLLLFIGYNSIRKGFQPARYFLVSMGILAFSGMTLLLVRLGLLPSQHFLEQGFFTGIIFFVLLMSLALADRIKLLRREKEKAIQELRDSEERFRALVETTNDFIWEIDKNGVYTYVSPKAKDLLGYEQEEILGKKPHDFMPQDEADRVCALLEEKFFKCEPIIDLENKNITKNGRSVVLDTNGVPFFDEEGNLQGYRGIDRDITQRKRLEEEGKRLQAQIQHAQKLESLGVLAGGIAHDLNNILTAIMGNTELTLRGFEKGRNIREYLDQITLGGKKASELVAKILAFSRKQIINPQVIDPNNTIKNFSKILHRLISEDIKIQMNLHEGISPIKADPMQIEQILINLMINAQDALKQSLQGDTDKIITVETEEVFLDKDYASSHVGSTVGQHILISVTDNGIGMDKEIVNRIFEPFFTTKDLGKGTGLGLSTVYGIVKQNNGSIYVYSELGIGTTIKIYWPACKEKDQLIEMDSGEKVERGVETILFVEDDDKIRKSSEELLLLYGYQVVSAQNGRHALKQIQDKKIKIDVLVTDVVMPEMGGIQLTEKLKTTYPELKVLYCSGYPDNHIVSANGILDKDVNFLSKPYSSKELVTKIREILDK
jgi:PAS domain S-box-containing protein